MLKKTKVKRRNTEPSIVPLPANIAASPANDWSTYSFSQEHNYFYYCSLIWTLSFDFTLLLWASSLSAYSFIGCALCYFVPLFTFSSYIHGGPWMLSLHSIYILYLSHTFNILALSFPCHAPEFGQKNHVTPCPVPFLSHVYCFAFNTHTATLTHCDAIII